MVYPLWKMTKKHFPLPPSIITENFRYFLTDEDCLKAYEMFIEDLSCKND